MAAWGEFEVFRHLRPPSPVWWVRSRLEDLRRRRLVALDPRRVRLGEKLVHAGLGLAVSAVAFAWVWTGQPALGAASLAASLILPVAGLVRGADAFAAERRLGTLDALLMTPLEREDLMVLRFNVAFGPVRYLFYVGLLGIFVDFLVTPALLMDSTREIPPGLVIAPFLWPFLYACSYAACAYATAESVGRTNLFAATTAALGRMLFRGGSLAWATLFWGMVFALPILPMKIILPSLAEMDAGGIAAGFLFLGGAAAVLGALSWRWLVEEPLRALWFSGARFRHLLPKETGGEV